MAQIEGSKIILSKLFDNFWFNIPEYQRPYVWEEEEVEELLDDLWYAYSNKSDSEYFLGSLVLHKRNKREYDVLDGQQRLTTLFLMFLVIRDLLKNQEIARSCATFIIQKEDRLRDIPTRVKLLYKIRKEAQDFIEKFLEEKSIIKKKKEIENYLEKKNVTLRNMAKSMLFILNYLKEKTDLEGFTTFIFQKIVLMYVSTDDFEDAYLLFTILNNRGIPLQNSDILKSINIGAIENPSDQEKYGRIWENIENSFDEDEFNRFLSFIRTILVKEKARESLLKEFENIYRKKVLEKGKSTIQFLKKYRDIYYQLLVHIDFDIDNNFKNLISIMKFALPSTDWIPPLLFYYEKFQKKKLVEFLQKLEYKFTADWIIGESPTTRISNMNEILKKIDISSEPNEVLSKDDLFSTDQDELRNILNADIYRKKFARYVLLKLEYLQGDNVAHISNYRYISVEHVLPQNPPKSSEWTQTFSQEEIDEWKNKIGNLILISKRKNSKLSNKDFKIKKTKYLSGRIDIFPSSKIFQKYEKWDLSILKKRQKKLIDKFLLNNP